MATVKIAIKYQKIISITAFIAGLMKMVVRVDYCTRCNIPSYYQDIKGKYTCFPCQLAIKLEKEKNIKIDKLPNPRRRKTNG